MSFKVGKYEPLDSALFQDCCASENEGYRDLKDFSSARKGTLDIPTILVT